MTVNAIILIFEDITDKDKAFDESSEPKLAKFLIEEAKKGIFQDEEKIAEINYIQNATGECDYIIQITSSNVANLMKAINIIRTNEQVNDTYTHIGQILYPEK